MCRQCVAAVMMGHEPNTPIDEERWAAIEWPEQTPEMERLGDAVERLYSLPGCEVGGPLHIIVDDYGVEDSAIDYCERTFDSWMSKWSGDYTGTAQQVAATAREIIELMRPMSVQQRVVALGRAQGFV